MQLNWGNNFDIFSEAFFELAHFKMFNSQISSLLLKRYPYQTFSTNGFLFTRHKPFILIQTPI